MPQITVVQEAHEDAAQVTSEAGIRINQLNEYELTPRRPLGGHLHSTDDSVVRRCLVEHVLEREDDGRKTYSARHMVPENVVE